MAATVARTRKESELEKAVASLNVQESNCRFLVSSGEDGKPRIKLVLFHQTVSCLAGMNIEFEVMGGTSLQQLKP